MIKEAIHILQHQQPDQHFVQTLIDASDQHPYASSLRVLLARASHLSGDARFDDDVRAAAIRTHNRKQLHDFVYTPLIEAIEMKPVLEEPNEVLHEEESTTASAEINEEVVLENVETVTTEELIEEIATSEKADTVAEANELTEENASKEKVEESVEEEKPSNKFNLDQARIEVLEKQFLTEALASGAAIELMGENTDEDNSVNYAGNLRDKNHNESAQKRDTTSGEEPKSVESNTPKQNPERLSLSGWLHLLETDELNSTDSSRTIETEEPSESGEEGNSEKKVHTKSNEVKIEPKEGTQSIKQAADIISNFIQNEDQIVPKRAEFFSPAKAAKNSLKDKDDLVTETLANIYAAQGNIEKAISTYEKLSLLHPEKSTYFAALIEKLKRQL